MIHRDGLKFLLPAIAVSALAYVIHFKLFVVCVLITLYIGYFFRSPKRYLPNAKNVAIAPADGIIVDISQSLPPKEISYTDKPVTKISIFLNIFDVHVNCFPINGEVVDIQYYKGQFLNASFDKASEKNERNSVVLKYGKDKKMGVVQIAGLIARRIRCDAKIGDQANIGEIFGLIRFGSRVDIYFDAEEKSILVSKGQRVRMGETPLVYF